MHDAKSLIGDLEARLLVTFQQYKYKIADNGHDSHTTLDGGDHGQEDKSGGTGVDGGAESDARGTCGIENRVGA